MKKKIKSLEMVSYKAIRSCTFFLAFMQRWPEKTARFVYWFLVFIVVVLLLIKIILKPFNMLCLYKTYLVNLVLGLGLLLNLHIHTGALSLYYVL